jgi:hypothetical protein
MSYETAPATELVATCCAFCGRPLVDANSLAAGVGPECRKKYGIGEELDEEQRGEANRAIYTIAAHQTGDAVAEALEVLYHLGLSELCARIEKRLAPSYAVVIGQGELCRFTVRASYELAMRANLGLVKGRKWDKELKLNTFPASSRGAVWQALKLAAPGQLAFGPKGEFRI